MNKFNAFLHFGFVFAFILAVLSPSGVALAKPDGYEYYLTGNPGDVTKTTTPGFLLAGGNTDVDSAMQWLIDQSGGGDFVVIRASGADGYNSYVYSELGRTVELGGNICHEAGARRL